VRTFQVGRVDDAVVLAEGAAELPLVHHLGDLAQQLPSAGHVIGLEWGAREHHPPVWRKALAFEQGQVDRGRVTDRSEQPLRSDRLPRLRKVLLSVSQADGVVQRRPDALAVAADVVGAHWRTRPCHAGSNDRFSRSSWCGVDARGPADGHQIGFDAGGLAGIQRASVARAEAFRHPELCCENFAPSRPTFVNAGRPPLESCGGTAHTGKPGR